MDNQRKTFLLDSIRGAFDGIPQAMMQSIILLIAVKYFQASDLLTSLIAAAPFIGLMLSIFYVSRFAESRFTKSQLVAIPTFLGGLLFILSGMQFGIVFFTVMTSLSMIVAALRVPFLLGIYEENFKAGQRGLLFSAGLLLTILFSIGSNFVFGKMLDRSLDSYVMIMVISGLAGLASALVIMQMPSGSPCLKNSRNPLGNMKLLFQDKVFGYMVLVWFIAGFANLWVRPLRVIWLAESERGLNLDPMTVLIILGIIPEAVRLLFTQFWAYLFDRLNFIFLRMILNLFQAIGLLLFFISSNIMLIALGSLFQGVGYAGGTIAWNLWVTKFAPQGKSQIYMSIHTFFTGVRGIIGPYIAFLFISSFSISEVGFVSFSLLILTIILMVPLLKMVTNKEKK